MAGCSQVNLDYRDLIENIHDGLYFVDTERRITYWNKAAERISGYLAGEVVGSRCSDNILIHVDEEGRSLCKGPCPLAATIADGSSRETQVYLHHKDGHRVPVLVRSSPLRSDDGSIIGGAELFTDVSSQSAMALKIEELEKLAYLDNLTQLANRHYIGSELESRFSEMRRYNLDFGVLLMDIDHFKRFNDTYGHDVGDRVLQTVAKTLRVTGRPYDLYGRWGGEEFIGLIRNVDASVLSRVGNRCRVLVKRSLVRVGGDRLSVTVSIGATLARSGDSAQSLVKRADRLLYRSKAEGRNRLTTD